MSREAGTPGRLYYRVTSGYIQLVFEEKVISTMSPKHARDNAIRLIEAAACAEAECAGLYDPLAPKE